MLALNHNSQHFRTVLMMQSRAGGLVLTTSQWSAFYGDGCQDRALAWGVYEAAPALRGFCAEGCVLTGDQGGCECVAADFRALGCRQALSGVGAKP